MFRQVVFYEDNLYADDNTLLATGMTLTMVDEDGKRETKATSRVNSFLLIFFSFKCTLPTLNKKIKKIDLLI